MIRAKIKFNTVDEVKQYIAKAMMINGDIVIRHSIYVIDGKSIMGLMMLAVGWGAEIKVTADGPDEAETIAALEELVNGKFGEA